ncbi:MAG: hypothetical protein JW787_13080 [Sedimentisphaerales bacterium]|nr:hypothetical protein [Sedimentisphaerales bacterium]
MNTTGICILTVLIAVVLSGSRKWALLGMMAGVLYLTQGEKIEIFGLQLFAIRFLEIAGFARIIIRREFQFSNLNEIDRAFLWLYCYTTVIFLLRSTEGQLFQIGVAVDSILCYFTFRALITNYEDFKWFLRAFIILLVPYLVLLTIESMTNHNLFAIVGGAPEGFGFRNGRPRCLGSFRNPVLLGTLGTSFLSLYIGLAFSKTDRIRAFVGIGLCLGIIWFSNSGGPVTAAAVVMVGWAVWFLRMKMRLVINSIVGLIVLLSVFMKAPVWYLPAKLTSIVGGHGWHRSYLMDIAFRNLDKWWLAGIPIVETKDWFPYVIEVTGGADITNQFLAFGLRAGLIAIALFILLLIRSFSSLGKELATVRSKSAQISETEFMLWGLGVMVCGHITTWLGITYFDQMYVIWFMQLAAITSLSKICQDSFR